MNHGPSDPGDPDRDAPDTATPGREPAPGSSPPPLLSIRNLQVDFGTTRTVDGVSLDLAAGETLGLVGESGSGKSVTALSIARLLPSPPARIVGGNIRLDGMEVLKLSEPDLRALRGKAVAYVFQEPATSLHPLLRVQDQILETLRLHRPASATREEVTRLLRDVGIPDPERRARDYPHHLSGGMQQRVMIAMALASEPGLLVADEPTTALDVTIQAEILQRLRTVQQQRRMAILLITHNLGIVAEIANRVAVMYAGELIEQGPATEVLHHPAHPYTRALIDSVPDPRRVAARLVSIPGTVPSPGQWPAGCRFAPRCPLAEPRCRTDHPALREIGLGHSAACHLASPALQAPSPTG